MNSEDRDLIEIEKMLETLKETEPAPELRGAVLGSARKTWQSTSNFSRVSLLKWAVAAIIIFSIGYYAGMLNNNRNNETVEEKSIDQTSEEFRNLEKSKDQIMKSER